MKQSRKRTKRTLAIIAAVLVVVISLVMLVRQSTVQEDTSEYLTMQLDQENFGARTTMTVYNMHPGDERTDTLRVKVAYHDRITLRFGVNYENRFAEVAEIFRIRVKLLTTGEALYDGIISRIPESLDYEMTADEAAMPEEGIAEYEVTVYLDPEAKDIYQYRKLNVSYGCWAGDPSNLEPHQDRETTQNILWLSTAILAATVATTLIARNQKDRLGREYQTL